MPYSNSIIKDNKTKLVLFLYAAFILVTFIIIDKIFFYNNVRELVQSNGKAQIEARQSELNSFIDESKIILNNLGNSKDLESYFKTKNILSLEELKKTILFTAKNHNEFMQIRFIDKSGNELIRVERESINSNPKLNSDLQNKANRYYFKESKNKPLGKVWFSSLDLNYENGVLQKPFNATLRAVYPIGYENEFSGVLIINFFMNDFLEGFKNVNLFDLILIDNKGFIISHYQEEKDWGFYKEEEYSIKTEFNQYKKILSLNSYEGYDFISKKLDSPILNAPILIAKPKDSYIANLYKNQNIQYFSIVVLVLFLTYIASFFILKVLKRLYTDLSDTKKLNKELNKVNEKLNTILDTTNDMVIILNEKRIIEFCNKASILVSGYNQKDLLGKKVDDFLGEHEEVFLKNFNESILKQSNHKKFEFISTNKDKEKLVLFITLTKIKNQKKVLLIARDITGSKEQQELFIQQSKLASMGEMLSNIAHQWRQPLNRLSLTSTNLKYKYQFGKLDENTINEVSSNLDSQINYLSQTIDDFRDFFTPRKQKAVFKIADAISKTLNIIGTSIKEKGIDIRLQMDNNLEFESYKNQLEQVLINILNNAKDALLENKVDNPFIEINLYNNGKNIIKISNNAGAIEEKVLSKIFEPYFSTKFSSNGTGLGLYMSKTIIENNMNGRLMVNCEGDTTTFTIEL